MLKLNRWFYYIGALFQSMACAGAIFGWVNMAYMLQKEGVFSSLCPPSSSSTTNTNEGCKEQTLAFNTVYSTASVFAFVVPLGAGSFLDRYGPQLTIRILSSIFAIGVLLLLVSTYTRSESLLYPAFIFLGSSASSNILPLYSVSNLFPQRKSLALSILSGAFDSGAIVFLIMARLYDSGIPFSTLILSYLCGPVILLLLLAMFLWPNKLFTEHDLQSTSHSFHNIPISTPKKDFASSPDDTGLVVSTVPSTTVTHDDSPPSNPLAVPSSSKSPQASPFTPRSPRPLSPTEPIDDVELRIPSATTDLTALGKNAITNLSRSSSSSSSSSVPSSSPSKGSTKISARNLSKTNSKLAVSSNSPTNLRLDIEDKDTLSDEDDDTVKPHTPLFRSSSVRTTNEGSIHDGHQSPMARTKSNSSLSHPTVGDVPKTTLVNTLNNNSTNKNTATLDIHDDDNETESHDTTTATITTTIPSPNGLSIAQRYLPGIDTDRISNLSLLQQICTPEYGIYVIFFTFMIIRFQFYIGTINTQLDVLGQVDAEYGKLFGYILPCGALSVFVIGYILDTYGPIIGMFSLILLAIVLSILNLVPVLPLQPLTFLLFGFFRGFLFCNMSVYLSMVFGYKYLGTLIGLLTTIGGLLGLLQQPLLLWAYYGTPPTEPNFYPPNILMLVLMILGIAWPMWLAYRAGFGSLWNVLALGGKK